MKCRPTFRSGIVVGRGHPQVTEVAGYAYSQRAPRAMVTVPLQPRVAIELFLQYIAWFGICWFETGSFKSDQVGYVEMERSWSQNSCD